MLMISTKKGIAYNPMFIVVVYLLVTMFLFEFGPIDWKINNSLFLYTLLFIYILFFVIGYLFGVSSHRKKYDIIPYKEKELLKFIKKLLPIAILFFIITSIRNYGYSSFNITGLINEMLNGLNNIGAGYQNKVRRINENISGNAVFGGTLITLIIYIWDFLDYNILLLSIKYFRIGNLFQKFLTIILCGLHIIYYIANGTNIGIFRILLAIFIFFILDKGKNRKIKISIKKKISVFIIGITFGIIVFSYFSQTMSSRGAYDNGARQLIKFGNLQLNQVGNWNKIIPGGLYNLFLATTSYTTQGYYGMSLALNENWTPMFGLGSNMAVVNLFEQYFPGLINNTFQYKIERHFGWSSTVQWSSFYTWLANDFSFVGVIIVMFILGKIMAMSFIDSFETNNPFASLVFYYTTLICLFIPGNNQIGQSFSTLFSFFIALIWWTRTRKGKSYNIIRITLGGKSNARIN